MKISSIKFSSLNAFCSLWNGVVLGHFSWKAEFEVEICMQKIHREALGNNPVREPSKQNWAERSKAAEKLQQRAQLILQKCLKLRWPFRKCPKPKQGGWVFVLLHEPVSHWSGLPLEKRHKLAGGNALLPGAMLRKVPQLWTIRSYQKLRAWTITLKRTRKLPDSLL